MQNERKMVSKLFIGVSILGWIIVLTEIFLRSLNQSICPAAGCQLVARYARFGDVSILLLGFMIFSLLIAFCILRLYYIRPLFDTYINFILIVSLACEGFFTGFQAFRIHMPCPFCLTIFGLLILLGLIRMLEGEYEVIVGFASMVGVFSLCYLILPIENTATVGGKPVMPIVGRPAPEFNLTLFSGKRVALNDFRGKSVVINFWSSG